MFRLSMQAFMGPGEKGIPQGLKPLSSDLAERPKAKAFGYLEAKANGEVSSGERAKAEALAYLEASTDTAPKMDGPSIQIEEKQNGGSMRRWMSAAAVCLLAVVMLGADPSARFEKLGHEMICTCGCGQILLECNHVGCPVSPVMINELHAQMDGGGSDTLVLNWFAAKYGATVLAAPIRGGFDNVAWIAPMAAFLLATLGVGFLIRSWTVRRVPVKSAAPNLGDAALRERIRRETEY
jgi:cytochrome c-type biogenesis protein CcmH/NrfF